MTNKEIEASGFAAVISYEEREGRKTERVHRCGYDLFSNGNGIERHIEVKATEKPEMQFRWLEAKEHDLATNDPHFYLYLVTLAGSTHPRVIPYDRETLKRRFSHVESHYIYKFPKADFITQD